MVIFVVESKRDFGAQSVTPGEKLGLASVGMRRGQERRTTVAALGERFEDVLPHVEVNRLYNTRDVIS